MNASNERRRPLLRALASAAVLVLALGACGDNDRPGGADGGGGGDGGGGSDAGIDAPPGATFRSYVLDLVQNQTADNTDPRPFTEFSDLPDTDADNDNAFGPLFP